MGAFRRTTVALVAVALSAAIVRPQLADALVVRGDEYLYRAQPSRALGYYARALAIDAGDGAAADRFAFVAMMLHDRAAIAEALRVTSAYLQLHPGDTTVRLDRAMAFRADGNASGALADFSLAGAQTGDARALTFAGYAAKVLGKQSLARRLWSSALAVNHNFTPAARALERYR
jgi:tetratricopeptide (TPR) repeat protein